MLFQFLSFEFLTSTKQPELLVAKSETAYLPVRPAPLKKKN